METSHPGNRQRPCPHIRSQAERSVSTCPICGGDEIMTRWEILEFDYGSGDLAAELRVRVPLRRCVTCGFDYLDDAAEGLRHAAIRDHLGVLSPGRIRRIRRDHGMTRAALARLAGFDDASLDQWENGLAIQPRADDRCLRMLARPENIRRLQEFTSSRPAGGTQP